MTPSIRITPGHKKRARAFLAPNPPTGEPDNSLVLAHIGGQLDVQRLLIEHLDQRIEAIKRSITVMDFSSQSRKLFEAQIKELTLLRYNIASSAF